jgi:Peptidase family M23
VALQIGFALYPVCLAAIALYWLITARSRSALYWAVKLAATASIVLFAFVAGSWVFTSYYLRYVLIGIFALVVVYVYRREKLSRALRVSRPPARLVFSAIVLGLFTLLDAAALGSHVRPAASIDLSFPFASGAYYVIQGGNSVVTNPFHSLSGSKLAFDIAKLNTFGNRANGVAPRALSDYEIFGELVYSPCAGTVLAVGDTAADNPPGMPDREHPANYVSIKCGDVEIYMAHLMQGSAMVAPGHAVMSKQPLGRVGNSGNTLEPHLHIGAKKNGAEIGATFDGRWLSVNSVVIGIRRGGER